MTTAEQSAHKRAGPEAPKEGGIDISRQIGNDSAQRFEPDADGCRAATDRGQNALLVEAAVIGTAARRSGFTAWEVGVKAIQGDLACESYPAGDRSRRRFLKVAALGTLGVAAGASLAHAGDAEATRPPAFPRKGDEPTSHEHYMRRAIAMAKQVPEFPFGAVIVRRATGVIVAEGYNRSSESPTFHGEIDVINRCAASHSAIDWTALDLYTTAEPCPMCQSAIEWAGIPNVYYGTSIPHLRHLGWKQIEIRAEEVAQRTPFRQSKVVGGILAGECNALFEAAPKSKYKQ